MKCPHCLEAFFENWSVYHLGGQLVHTDSEGKWKMRICVCPTCGKSIIQLGKGSKDLSETFFSIDRQFGWVLVRPRGISRAPLSKDVSKEFAEEYNEACLVISDSAKASAALSRRCLQRILEDKVGVKKGNLSQEIQAVLDSKQLPGYLAENLDAVRNIGNFAAHPIKSTSSGEIVEVEPGEAEWNLDILEGLFDFYFVQPARMKEKRDSLDKKLAEAGKQKLKSP